MVALVVAVVGTVVLLLDVVVGRLLVEGVVVVKMVVGLVVVRLGVLVVIEVVWGALGLTLGVSIQFIAAGLFQESAEGNPIGIAEPCARHARTSAHGGAQRGVAIVGYSRMLRSRRMPGSVWEIVKSGVSNGFRGIPAGGSRLAEPSRYRLRWGTRIIGRMALTVITLGTTWIVRGRRSKNREWIARITSTGRVVPSRRTNARAEQRLEERDRHRIGLVGERGVRRHEELQDVEVHGDYLSSESTGTQAMDGHTWVWSHRSQRVRSLGIWRAQASAQTASNKAARS